jgi:hypothetical protein
MHHHLDEGHGRDADMLEVAWVCLPGFQIVDLLLECCVVFEECVAGGIDKLDVVVELWEGGKLAISACRAVVLGEVGVIDKALASIHARNPRDRNSPHDFIATSILADKRRELLRAD